MNKVKWLIVVVLGTLMLAACSPITAPDAGMATGPEATAQPPEEAESDVADPEDSDTEAEVAFVEIDTADYDFTGMPYYKKCAIVGARQAVAGEEIETIVDGLLETVNVANDGDYVVRNPGGEEYIVEQARFESRYTLIEGETDQFLSTGEPVQAIELDQNVEFVAPWGATQYILAGGFLIFNVDEVYGIQRQEFIDTYAPASPDGQFINAAGEPISPFEVDCPANQPGA